MVRCLIGVAALFVMGCCTSPPQADRYFDRTTPVDAVKMFQYACEVKQHDHAYATLSPDSHKLLSYLRFVFALDRAIDEMGGMTLGEIVAGELRILGSQDDAEAMVTVLGEEVGQDVYLVLVDDEWRIDLGITLEAMGIQVDSGDPARDVE